MTTLGTLSPAVRSDRSISESGPARSTITGAPLGAAELRGWLEGYILSGRHGFINSYEPYEDHEGWLRKAILNVAASGKFSSDLTIAEYAAKIWNAKPCPVP